jgi:hypothetical protein
VVAKGKKRIISVEKFCLEKEVVLEHKEELMF